MPETSIFADEWRECLREHYKHVVREQDGVTKPSLARVLHEVGFTDDELRELEVRATMHVDDVQEDFVPNFVHPAECTCAACSPQAEAIQAALEAAHDDEGQPLSEEAVAEREERQAEGDDEDEDDDKPQQLSMF